MCPVFPSKKHALFQSSFIVFPEGVIYLFYQASTEGGLLLWISDQGFLEKVGSSARETPLTIEMWPEQAICHQVVKEDVAKLCCELSACNLSLAFAEDCRG